MVFGIMFGFVRIGECKRRRKKKKKYRMEVTVTSDIGYIILTMTLFIFKS